MRYKLLALAAALFIGTPAFAQEMSPIVIETGQPVPSVVRSGESFRVTYRAKFYDQVLIVEGQMQPENIVAEPFEAIKLEVLSLPDHGDDSSGIIHIRDFVYTFRIIKPEKGDKKIPPFNFFWVIKKAGTTEDNAKEQNELKEIPTEEVGVRYVYSPVKPPPLNIRDEINFPLFKWNGETLRNYGYATAIISFLLSLIIMVVWAHFGKTKVEKVSEKNAGETSESQAVVEVVPNIFPKRARKKLLRELKLLQGEIRTADEEDLMETEKELCILLREYVLAELSGSSVSASTSDTPNELYTRLLNLEERQKREIGKKYSTILDLSEKLRNYYKDIESGTVSVSYLADIPQIINVVEGLSWKRRVWKALRKRIGGKNVG
ncbi:MAG: hypothetical protein Q8R55_07915 [Candidatus Taylorbacteria bacterium]|nr:hypothetical protein [Candidatus Taylorbacteria bacterium]